MRWQNFCEDSEGVGKRSGTHVTTDIQTTRQRGGQAGRQSTRLPVSDTHAARGRVRVSTLAWCKFSVFGFWFSGCGHKLSQTKSFVPFRAKRALQACIWLHRAASCELRAASMGNWLQCSGFGLGFQLRQGRLISLESQFHFKLKPNNVDDDHDEETGVEEG